MKAYGGWAHLWACATRVLMGDEATSPVYEDGNWMRVVEWYMAWWAQEDEESVCGR